MPGAPETVLAVFAHPDDESLVCGGTFARLADAGTRVVLLCGSRGERGSVSDPSLVEGSTLADVRARELNEAARTLGIRDVRLLNHRDGNLRWEAVPQFHAEIVSAIEEVRPSAVITFAEEGLYWHLDHIGVHERTYTAVASLGAEAPPLYYATIPAGIMRGVVDAAHARAGAEGTAGFWGIEPDAFGIHALPPTFSIDVRDWAPRKLAALRCHRTQVGRNSPIAWIDDDEARRWLGIEYFRRSPLPSARVDVPLEEFGQAMKV